MYILLVFIIVISFPLGYWITFQPISYLLYKMEKSFAPIFLKNFFFNLHPINIFITRLCGIFIFCIGLFTLFILLFKLK